MSEVSVNLPGIDLSRFEKGQEIFVKTHNSIYHFKFFVDRWQVVGGSKLDKPRFEEYTPVEIIGSAIGCALKKKWICCRMSLEFYDIIHDSYVHTSVVESIKVLGDGWHYEIALDGV